MGELIFDTLKVIFGGGMITDVTDFLDKVITGTSEIFNNQMDSVIPIFSVIAGSLMVIFLYIDLTSQSTRELLTLERLVLTFIKFFIAMVILIYLPEIIQTLFSLTHGIYEMASDKFTTENLDFGISFFPDDGNPDPSTFPDSYDTVKSAFEAAGYKNGVRGVINTVGILIQLMLVNIVFFVAKAAAYFITVSTAIMVIVRAIFAPIGIVQLFDEGQRSSGVMYIKKFAAEALTFAAILGILYAASLLQAQLQANIVAPSLNGELSVENFKSIFSDYLDLVPLLVIQLSAAGAIIKSGQLCNDILGTR